MPPGVAAPSSSASRRKTSLNAPLSPWAEHRAAPLLPPVSAQLTAAMELPLSARRVPRAPDPNHNLTAPSTLMATVIGGDFCQLRASRAAPPAHRPAAPCAPPG